MNIPQRCDVVVIGGGPAGALAATFLSRSGHHVVVLDRQHFPRTTVGESLIPDVWKYCDAAGVTERILAEGFVRKAGGLVEWNGEMRTLSFRDFGYTRPALHVERDSFDAILLDHAGSQGAEVHQGITVTRVETAGDGEPVRVEFRPTGSEQLNQIECRYVVDASGQNALLARQAGSRQLDEAFRFMSIWGYFENANYLAVDGSVHSAAEVTEIAPSTYVTNIPDLGDWGWCWHIALRRNTSVGLIVPVDAVKGMRDEKESWEQFYLAQCARLPRLAQLLAPGRYIPGSVRIIRNYSYRSEQLAGPGYYLIGDAAGFLDPIFSVGVVLAMHGAYAAAWAIDQSLREPQRAADYRAIFADQLKGRMEVSRALALPGYQCSEQANRLAQDIVKLTDKQAQALMQAASRATARPHNFDALLA